MQLSQKALERHIRRTAKRLDLVARKSRRNHRWYVADRYRNALLSDKDGMDEQEALEWLRDEARRQLQELRTRDELMAEEMP